MQSSENVFKDKYLKFEICKPDDWTFIQPAWSPIAKLNNSADPETDWMAHGSLPFCCIMRHHASLEHIYSSTQVSCRPFHVPDSATIDAILKASIDLISGQSDDLQVDYVTPSALIAGCKASILRSRFTHSVANEQGISRFPVISRSIQIFAPGRMFTLGMSSSADPQYYDESEFESMIASVRIDT